MELRKEYAEIAIRYEDTPCKHSAIHVATLCQELADRPPRELTDAEIYCSFGDSMGYKVNADQAGPKWIVAVRAVIAAHIAKQREPQVVKFRAARWKDGAIDMLNASEHQCQDWQWLEPAQEFEVRI